VAQVAAELKVKKRLKGREDRVRQRLPAVNGMHARASAEVAWGLTETARDGGASAGDDSSGQQVNGPDGDGGAGAEAGGLRRRSLRAEGGGSGELAAAGRGTPPPPRKGRVFRDEPVLAGKDEVYGWLRRHRMERLRPRLAELGVAALDDLRYLQRGA
jgi:hypothetical protein